MSILFNKYKIIGFGLVLNFSIGYNVCCSNVKDCKADEFNKIIKNNKNIIILDVRTSSEYNDGHIKGAININYYNNDFINLCDKKLDKTKLILVYCQGGYRSKKASHLLMKNKFNVLNLKGGIDDWIKKGYPVEE